MSTADAGGPDGRAPGAPTAEAWPDDARVVALIAPPDAGRRACELAVELADASGADRRTLLANLAGGAPDLDGHLGSTAEEGLFDAGRSGRSLREIATRPSGRSFLYLPAGGVEAAPGGGGDDADGGVRPRLAGLMARVAERVREKDGRLLLFLTGEGEWPEALPRLLDGMVLLPGAAPPGGWGEAAPPVLGLRPAEEEEADDGAATGAGEPGAWRRHRRSSGAPWTRIAAGAAAVVALAAGWWWLVREAAPGDDGRGDAAAVEIAAEPPGGAPGADGTEAPGGEGPAAPAAEGDAGAVVAGARALPYSVLIASYAQWPQARRRLEAWRGPSEPVYFVAPTRVRGGLYWRLFAGAVADRATGEALMERLVDLGRKDRARAWDVRPVEFAFLAGTAASRSAAEARVEALEERGVPAYTVPAVSGGDTAWAVYSGGFESDEEASELRALLGEAEIEGELVTRRGESDTR